MSERGFSAFRSDGRDAPFLEKWARAATKLTAQPVAWSEVIPLCRCPVSSDVTTFPHAGVTVVALRGGGHLAFRPDGRYCISAPVEVERLAPAAEPVTAVAIEPDPAPAPAKSCEDLTAREAAAYLGYQWGTFRNNWKRWGIRRLRNRRYSVRELDRWKSGKKSE